MGTKAIVGQKLMNTDPLSVLNVRNLEPVDRTPRQIKTKSLHFFNNCLKALAEDSNVTIPGQSAVKPLIIRTNSDGTKSVFARTEESHIQMIVELAFDFKKQDEVALFFYPDIPGNVVEIPAN